MSSQALLQQRVSDGRVEVHSQVSLDAFARSLPSPKKWRCDLKIPTSDPCLGLFRYNCRAQNFGNIPESLNEPFNLVAQINGFRSADKFNQILSDFLEAHSWTLLHYVKAAVMLIDRDPEYANMIPGKLLVFMLRSTVTQGSSRNPAQTFKLLGHRWETIEEYTSDPSNARIWQETAPLREAVHTNGYRNPQFVGVLPVRFVVENMVSFTGKTLLYSLCRQRPCSPELTRIWEESRDDIFTTAHELFVKSINSGLVLRYVEGQESPAVLPGRYIRRHRRWIWKPLFTDWDKYLSGHRGIDKVDALLEPYTGEDERASAPDIFGLVNAL